METIKLEDWQKEMQAKFPLSDEAAFVCPRYCKVSTVSEFKKLGISPQLAPTECIGRHGNHNCDWSAYGLLGTLDKGRKIIMPDGKEVEVFEFGAAVGAQA